MLDHEDTGRFRENPSDQRQRHRKFRENPGTRTAEGSENPPVRIEKLAAFEHELDAHQLDVEQ